MKDATRESRWHGGQLWAEPPKEALLGEGAAGGGSASACGRASWPVAMIGPRSETDMLNEPRERRIGVAYALTAFIWWGGNVFYFKAVELVPAYEVLAHRIVWAAVLLGALVTVRGRMRQTLTVLRDRRRIAALAATACLIASTWYVYIWAIGHDRVLEASLGYFLMPLVNVLLGFVFLRERFSPLQVLAFALAGAAVATLWIHFAQLPYLSLYLAFSFGIYGLARKMVSVDPLIGLAAETTLLTPVALLLFWRLRLSGQLVFGRADGQTNALLLAAGLITALPLACYINAAKRLRYATLGVIQYLVPSIIFVVAVFVYREPFDRIQLASFILIWVAMAAYTVDSMRTLSRTSS